MQPYAANQWHKDQDKASKHRESVQRRMLTQGAKSMSQVAYALGYEEQSFFNRAFKRWTGEAPKTWLERQPS